MQRARLRAQIPEYCRVTDEDEITAHAYELIFAFDELVTLGYNENLTISQARARRVRRTRLRERAPLTGDASAMRGSRFLTAQVRTFTEMESHEEKVQEMIARVRPRRSQPRLRSGLVQP